MYPTPIRRSRKVRRSYRKSIISALLLLVVAGSYATITISQPFASLQPRLAQTSLNVTTPAANLPWPSYGQGAFGLTNGKVLATTGSQEPLSIASATKVITALVVLEKYPIKAKETGPTITLTEQDVDSYRRYISIQGSVMPVRAGQQLTEKQMLEALLLPSANNIADSLAIWAFGSVDNYIVEANNFLARNGLKSTKVGGDASGYLADSQSTASDLVRIGAMAMSNPVLAEIVGKKTATIPETGVVKNYNSLLGTNNIVGIKTGNNDANGGVFIGAAEVTVNGVTTTVITALSGAPSLSRVLRDSGVLLGAIPGNIASTAIVTKDAILGTYEQPDGRILQAIASKDLNIVVLRGNSVDAKVTLEPIDYDAKAGDVVGTITVPATSFSPAQSVPVTLKQTPTKPDITYRLLHP